MRKILLSATLLLLFECNFCQENYEIQVYGAETMDKGNTMFELHSNFTFDGRKNSSKGVYPSEHETLEITQGITNDFELGFYLFTNYTNPYGYKIIGSHIRPRIMVPQKWHWPVGISLSTEFGFQKKQYSEDVWSLEIRPIVDRQWGNFYVSFNPTFGVSIKPDSADHVPAFEPNLKLSWTIQEVALGIEYYGELGNVDAVPKISEQNHALFFVADLNLDPKWEINFGPGIGLTNKTDRFVFKLIIGRRINWKKVS
jgi:hypothetical protein